MEKDKVVSSESPSLRIPGLQQTFVQVTKLELDSDWMNWGKTSKLVFPPPFHSHLKCFYLNFCGQLVDSFLLLFWFMYPLALSRFLGFPNCSFCLPIAFIVEACVSYIVEHMFLIICYKIARLLGKPLPLFCIAVHVFWAALKCARTVVPYRKRSLLQP